MLLLLLLKLQLMNKMLLLRLRLRRVIRRRKLPWHRQRNSHLSEQFLKLDRAKMLSQGADLALKRVALEHGDTLDRGRVGREVLQQSSVAVIVRAPKEDQAAVAIVEVQFEDL